MDVVSGNCSNKLKEEIEAKTVYGIQNKTVTPVNNVMKASRYRGNGRQSSPQECDFSEMLRKERAKEHQSPKAREEEKALCLMGGLNQYNRHALEVCFLLSSEMDYKA